ncbi:cation diffusion facilitator family transporter [Adhaeretor mobilis]|uniref:cation diffusion facilitator family transporter n=1 Tax=Adhaeretor mobilis TaxID=1930276 RepID=UPI0011A1329E|nr:cation diffusion facilitator family transporter [Adhaeretor mobilis]
MSHSHSHGHAHDHGVTNYGRAFALGVALNVLYVLVEAGYGLYAGSLALLSDAGHNLSDVFGLLLAWGGHALAQKPPTSRRTYGYRGTTILAAFLNALLLLVAIGAISWEAIGRFGDPAPTAGLPIIIVASIGVVINTATALLFVSGRKSDLNLQGAYLHMAADAAVSVGVVIAGIAIYFTQLAWIDPAVSLLIAGAIFASTWGLLRESINLTTQAVPAAIDPNTVTDYLANVAGVTEVHDLHIWAMSTTEVALTVHLVKPELADEDELLCEIQTALHDHFGIEHATIQIERGHGPMCDHASPERV